MSNPDTPTDGVGPVPTPPRAGMGVGIGIPNLLTWPAAELPAVVSGHSLGDVLTSGADPHRIKELYGYVETVKPGEGAAVIQTFYKHPNN